MHKIICNNCRSQLLTGEELVFLIKLPGFSLKKMRLINKSFNFTLPEENSFILDGENDFDLICPSCGHSLFSPNHDNMLRMDIKINEILIFPFFLIQTRPQIFDSFIQLESDIEKFSSSKIGKSLTFYNSIKTQKI